MNELMEPMPDMPAQPEEEKVQENPFTPAQMQLVQETISQALSACMAEKEQETQKMQQRLSDEENALSAREEAIREREMRAFAREQLLRRSLPEALLDALCCRDEESCVHSLDKVEAAFRTAVQQGVMERMRGEEPRRTAAPSLSALDDQAYYTATYQK